MHCSLGTSSTLDLLVRGDRLDFIRHCFSPPYYDVPYGPIFFLNNLLFWLLTIRLAISLFYSIPSVPLSLSPHTLSPTLSLYLSLFLSVSLSLSLSLSVSLSLSLTLVLSLYTFNSKHLRYARRAVAFSSHCGDRLSFEPQSSFQLVSGAFNRVGVRFSPNVAGSR